MVHSRTILSGRALSLGLAAMTMFTGGAIRAAQSTLTNDPNLAARSAWWRQAKFGMFIHWGLYAVPAGFYHGQPVGSAGEWILNTAKIPIPEYEQYARSFNPTKFNARDWVKTAKDAGMKYIVITSKHHDGFCMFDTKQTDYDIVDATPYHRDPMKELARECKRQGIRLCFYYSVMDWHHPDYVPHREWDQRPGLRSDFSQYLRYMKAQLTELLKNYGDIGVIWFDGSWEGDAAKNHSEEVVKMIRSLKPGILINDRINLPEDFSTPEQTIPAGAMPNGRLWETCMTMNDTWGFRKDDKNWKSATDLTRKLVDITSKGGNFLLNVGPQADGLMPAASLERLHEVGQWMKRNSESIYGATKSPWRKTPFEGRCTVKGSTLYIHAFEWPGLTLALHGLKTAVLGAKVLATGETVQVTPGLKGEEGAPGVLLSKPSRLDPVDTVIALRLAGPPVVENAAGAVAQPDAQGTITLLPRDAELTGALQVETKGNEENIGYWTDAKDKATWIAAVRTSGTYAVTLNYACEPGAAGTNISVRFLPKNLAIATAPGTGGVVEATAGWDDFRDMTLPPVSLPAGTWTVALSAAKMPHGAVMNLRRLRLAPDAPAAP